jgi:hypothetical protein
VKSAAAIDVAGVARKLFNRDELAKAAQKHVRPPVVPINPAPLFAKQDRRDDQALLDVVKQLPAALRRGVSNPVNPDESLTDRLRGSDDEVDMVEEAALQFEDLGRRLQAALDAGSAAQACIWMQGLFGPRFPDRPDRVKVGAAASAVAAAIAASPAIAGPNELVGRTRAG